MVIQKHITKGTFSIERHLTEVIAPADSSKTICGNIPQSQRLTGRKQPASSMWHAKAKLLPASKFPQSIASLFTIRCHMAEVYSHKGQTPTKPSRSKGVRKLKHGGLLLSHRSIILHQQLCLQFIGKQYNCPHITRSYFLSQGQLRQNKRYFPLTPRINNTQEEFSFIFWFELP